MPRSPSHVMSDTEINLKKMTCNLGEKIAWILFCLFACWVVFFFFLCPAPLKNPEKNWRSFFVFFSMLVSSLAV